MDEEGSLREVETDSGEMVTRSRLATDGGSKALESIGGGSRSAPRPGPATGSAELPLGFQAVISLSIASFIQGASSLSSSQRSSLS